MRWADPARPCLTDYARGGRARTELSQGMKRNSCLCFAFLVFLSINALAQVSRIEPAQPRWGQKLTIIYDTAAAGAKFTADDEVFAALRLSFPGYGENASARMT